MNRAMERLVRKRAADRCEYCLLPADVIAFPFQIDHIIARKHGGKTVAENLALACFDCNSHKGPCVAGLDGVKLTRLFNPRKDRWRRHFHLSKSGSIDGRSGVGRTTIRVLEMNSPLAITLRANLIVEADWIANLVDSDE